MYPDSARNILRSELKNYLDTRIDYFQAGDNEDKITKSLQQADSISHMIWLTAVRLSKHPDNRIATEQMIPSINSVIDIVATREAARTAVVPRTILIVLAILILVSAFLSGYGSKSLERNKVLVLAFAFMTTITLYLVVDMDKPRQGFVNLKKTELLMVDLRKNFSE